MTKVRKAYRLTSDLVSELAVYCEEHGVTATEAVESAIALYIQSGTQEAHTEETDGGAVGAAVQALTEQLRVKDVQIEQLGAALSQAQSLAHAAQALEGAQVAKALGDGRVTEGVERHGGRGGFIFRLKDFFR